MFKRIIVFLSIFLLMCTIVSAEGVELDATSAVLLDANSGEILYSKDPDIIMPPASITKIMTMLITVEEIEKGNVKLEDIVTVSKTAAIKTGSHVFLAENEQISVNDLLKSVAVSSANDAAIALAEHISGTKEEFVNRMNKRAKELNMKNTNFVNPNGLDADNHYSTANDIAIMTKELLKHKMIFNYTTIWMDTLRNGTFNLSNTNKLIRYYDGANGMKTGSTSKAGYCISATALRDGLQLIAVTMNSSTTQKRFKDSSTLLNYGFNNFSSVKLNSKDEIVKYANVEKSIKQTVPIIVKDDIFVTVKKDKYKEIKEEFVCEDKFTAPLKKGAKIGEIVYYLDNKELKRVELCLGEDVSRISFLESFIKIGENFFAFSLSNPQ